MPLCGYKRLWRLALRGLILFFAPVAACSDANDARSLRIGAECTLEAECENPDLTCLSDFRGGYCGQRDCSGDGDCPDGSMCVDEDGTTYCFLRCTEKSDCNTHRTAANEANCESSVTPVNPANTSKACVPPSSDL